MFVNFNILNQLGSPAINSNTFANRPAAGQTGRLFVSIDTFEIYRDNGTTWDLIGGPGSSTITGTGTATQVAYFTSSQAIGSSANLYWDNTSGFLGVATATPSARIEAVKTDGVGIYANFTTNAGSGSSTTALWAKNITNSSGFAAVIEETTPNTTAGQYPLLIKHSLSSGTAGVGMGTGIHWQLPDDAGTFKTTQLTIETINAAAATYATRYRFNVQNNGSSTPVAYINATGLGIFTATPGAALDIHSTGVIAQFNTTSGTGNTYVSFQRTGTGVWRIGDTYNSGANFFGLFNNSISTNAIAVLAATNKTEFTAVETYTTGLARGNYFDYNLSVAAGGSFSSPNAITALGASLDLTLAGNATIPSGARSGLDAYNSIAFTGAGTLTHNQGTQIRAYSNVTAGWAFAGSATGTITHLAGLRALFPDNSGSAVNVTNNYALLLNDQTANTGTVTYTNRWGVYQEGASDLNYMAANLLLGSTVNNGDKLQVNGAVSLSGNLTVDTNVLFVDSSNNRVGIGTTTLTNKLTVIDSQTGTQITTNPVGKFVNTGNDFSKFILGSDNANYDAVVSMDNNASLANCKLRFYIGNGTGSTAGHSNDQFVITGNNNIGIGTSTPTYKLEVQGNAFFSDNVTAKGTGNYTTFIVDNSSSATIGGGYYSAYSFGVFRGLFGTTGAVQGDGNKNVSIFAEGGTGMGAINFHVGGSGTPNHVMTSGGNLLIGTTTDAGQKLQVNGSVSIPHSNLYRSGSNAIKSSDSITVSTSATNIFTSQQVGGVDSGNLIVVTGVKSGTGDNFCDLVLFMTNGSAVTVSSTVIGSPPARTYSVSGNNLQLTMASGTYVVGTGGFIQGYNLTF